MKAFLAEKYGPPETLRLADVPKPTPGANEVLVRVMGISVNPADWRTLRAKPFFARAAFGLLRPKKPILGGDVAGRIEAVGSAVTGFEPGDEIYANLLEVGNGGFAEYVSVPVSVAAKKPETLSFEEAAAVPMAGITALQGLRHHGEIRLGQKVLVNGASGGVGHFAVQLAKSSGAEVTGVTSTKNIDLVRSLGADHVIDYTREDFTRTGQQWDYILDAFGNKWPGELQRALTPEGTAGVTGFTSIGKLVAASLRGGKRVSSVSAHATAEDLAALAQVIEAGKVRPSIDRRYSFNELPAALSYLEAGHARGKVIVSGVELRFTPRRIA